MKAKELRAQAREKLAQIPKKHYMGRSLDLHGGGCRNWPNWSAL